ncbi:MAG: sensor histidine kinase [Candidatus Velthaea sp.]
MLAAISLNFAFRQILLDAARLRAQATSDEIVQTIDASGTLSLFEPTPVLAVLSNRGYLEHWAGPQTYVQIDNAHGAPLAKSTNMGSLYIAPHLDFRSSDRSFEIQPTGDGGDMLVMDRLLFDNQRPVAIAHVGERLDDVHALLRRARTILMVVTIFGTVLVVLASYGIAATAINPIKRLTHAMAEIGSDRLDRRIETRSKDEVGQLAAAFNAMLTRLQEAFARERQFISDASHELKTPLTVINANAQLLKRWGNAEPQVRDESIDAIIGESAELAGLVTGMLTLAKADSGDQIPKAPLAVNDIVSDVANHSRERAERKGLVLEAQVPDDPIVVVGETSLLRQLVSNLIDNAIKFTERGRVDVTVERRGAHAIIDVADTGAGISAETAERLFDRFFRGDASHSRVTEGTGLGLAIVRSIARVHGGTVTARPRPAGGSLFSVTLPAVEAAVIESQ